MDKSKFDQMFNRTKAILREKIKGREKSSEWVNPESSNGNEEAFELKAVPINTPQGMFDFSFSVHSDCRCASVQEFLDVVTIDSISFAEGARGGKLLGVSGKSIDHLYVYKK